MGAALNVCLVYENLYIRKIKIRNVLKTNYSQITVCILHDHAQFELVYLFNLVKVMSFFLILPNTNDPADLCMVQTADHIIS